MTEQKKEVQIHLRMWNRISTHTVFEPITIPALAIEFGISERDVKACLEHLVDAGCKIGSSKKKPKGVFKANHPAEIFSTAERLTKEGIRYLVRAKKLLTWDGVEPTIFEQMPEIDDIVAQYSVTDNHRLPTD
jgi:hypothetical protein